MRRVLPFFFFLQANFVLCQSFTTSNLPIVILNTGGAIIEDELKVEITMGIIDNQSAVNNVTNPWNSYHGAIGIEFRGNSTQGFVYAANKKWHGGRLGRTSSQIVLHYF